MRKTKSQKKSTVFHSLIFNIKLFLHCPKIINMNRVVILFLQVLHRFFFRQIQFLKFSFITDFNKTLIDLVYKAAIVS
jgi:hypothetical protein